MLVPEGIQLRAFADAAHVYSRLDAATRAAVDRAGARVGRTELVFHPEQAAVSVLDASDRGPAEFAALLAVMGDDIPTGWITRADSWLSSRSAAWSKVCAVLRALSPSTRVSFQAVVDEVRRVSGSNIRRERASLLGRYRDLELHDAQELCGRALALRSAEPLLQSECESILEHAVCVIPGALQGHYAELLDAGILYPPVLFRGADDVARARLIRTLETLRAAPEIRHALAALAGWKARSSRENSRTGARSPVRRRGGVICSFHLATTPTQPAGRSPTKARCARSSTKGAVPWSRRPQAPVP